MAHLLHQIDACIRGITSDLAMTVTIADSDRRNIQMMASIIVTQLCNSKLYSASHLRTHYRQMHSDMYTSRNRKILSTTITLDPTDKVIYIRLVPAALLFYLIIASGT